MIFSRIIEAVLEKRLFQGKAIILMGARQVGKTTLIKKMLQGKDYLFLDADDPTVRNKLTYPNTEQLKTLIGNYRLVFIDEAQRIPGIGLTLKIITDQLNHVQLMVSGSSSFDLANQLNEPLTGRKWEYQLFPVSWEEYEKTVGYLTAEQSIENRLLFGFYPEVLKRQGDEKETLLNLVNSYLYKDLLSFADIRKPEVLEDLLRALAFQIGNEVNYSELSQLLRISKNTVQHYVDLLEKGYVIFRLSSFSRNIRNEIKQNRKIYFVDTGIRNTLIGNFNPLDMRPDKGALWENFLVAERLKQNMYKNRFAKMYFWRTKQQQEIDFVEEVNGKITAFEFKWQASKRVKFPEKFMETYQAASTVIDRNNFREFVEITP